jgi:hypothetical protein
MSDFIAATGANVADLSEKYPQRQLLDGILM